MKSSVFRAESIKGNSSWSLGLFAGVLAIALDVSGQFSLADEPREPFFSANELHLRPVPPELGVTGTFANGVCTLLAASEITGPWSAAKSVFTTNEEAVFTVLPGNSNSFYRASARDLSGGRVGFTNLTLSYGVLSTIAGAGGIQDINNWRPEFEGAPATNALLSGPHIAVADRAGYIYIADKDAHGVRKIRRDGTIITVAGTSLPGNGPDIPTPGTQVALTEPNGLWVHGDGTLFILDLGNGKVRRLDTNGILRTLFTVPGGILIGRGLWVSDDETLAYFCSSSVVKKWTTSGGVTDFVTGFISLGNLAVDPGGNVLVTDRSGHRVYRLSPAGDRTVIAGNGLTLGGGDGQLAIDTALEEVRGVWCMPNGALLVATHRSSRVWYIDTGGYIHLMLHGNRNGAHAGDGTWFYNPLEARVSECRAVTMDYDGNILITENDVGFIRRVQFLPFQPPGR
jgi:sugar lactone lactonase YvrE